MNERNQLFSAEEEQQISTSAVALARLGEKDVDAVELIKLQLLTVIAMAGKDPIVIENHGNEIQLTKNEARQKADILEQVVFRARAILQIEGRDSISLRNEFYIKEGWGSIFDPESRIRKLLDSNGITVY